jgi:hypothetical protein
MRGAERLAQRVDELGIFLNEPLPRILLLDPSYRSTYENAIFIFSCREYVIDK